MAVTGIIHHFGTFLLFAATIFLVITNIAAPVVHDIALLKVRLPASAAGSEISFGTYGWCILDARGSGNDLCSGSSIGYNPAAIVEETGNINYSDYTSRTAEGLTRVMVLHPIAAAIVFIAFVMGLGASFVGSFLASLVAGLGFIVTLVALICDFVMFALIASVVNNDRQRNSGSNNASAYYSVGLWTILASAICSFLATIILFFTCCSARMRRRRAERTKVDHYHSPSSTRRRWWSRR